VPDCNEYKETRLIGCHGLEAAYNENVMQPLYDYQALFAAKALIFEHSQQDLARYLDVPAFARGDLFYIQNLIYTIEAQ
jgi:hypothetical protein